MSLPSSQLSPSPGQGSGLPRRLRFLTLPLMIALVYNALSLLSIPFSGPLLNEALADYGKVAGQTLPPLAPEVIQTALWISFLLTAALILWIYFTRRAVLEGKSSGRVSSIVIAVLSLLLFPFGTVLGVVMLIGAFDKEVVAYLKN